MESYPSRVLTLLLRRATPYFHGLIGAAARHTTTLFRGPQHSQDVLAVNFGFAMAAGAGLNSVPAAWLPFVWRTGFHSRHLAPQDPQFSPVRTQLPNLGTWQNCVRMSFGIVLSPGGGS